MTLSDAVTMFGQKATLEQSVYSGTDTGSAWSVSNDNATALLNESIRRFALRGKLRDVKVAFTLTASTGEYRMNSSSIVGAYVLEPKVVYIDGSPLYGASGRSPGMWSLDEFEVLVPDWRTNTDEGQPYLACYACAAIGSGSAAGAPLVILYPKPSSAYAALATHYIDGYARPFAMVYSTDSAKELKLPEDLHHFIVDLAVAIGETPNASEAEHWNRLDRMTNGASEALAWFRQAQERARSWGSTRIGGNRDEVCF